MNIRLDNMDKRKFNLSLNKLKDKFPEKLLLIESIQRAYNRDIPTISRENLRQLYQNPASFVCRIKCKNGEWTTKLHQLAENGLEDLLKIDPLYLITKNSYGDTVLMSLIEYAVGKTTEQINYDLLRKILECPMTFKYVVNSKSPMVDGCVWDIQDITGRTPIDYLSDMASGSGTCDGCEPIVELAPLIKEWSERSLATMGDGVDDYPDDEALSELDEFEDEEITASDLIDDATNKPQDTSIEVDIIDDCPDDLENYIDENGEQQKVPEEAQNEVHDKIQNDAVIKDTGIWNKIK